MNMLPVRLLHLLLLAATASSALAYPIRTSWVDPADLPPSRMGHYRDHLAYLRRQSPEHRQALRQRSAARADALRDAQQHERQGRSLQFTAAQGPLAIKFLIDQVSFASQLTPEGAAAVEAALPDVAAIASQILQARNPPPKPLLIMPACIFYVYGTDTSDGKDICIAPWFSADLSLTLSGDYLKELWMCDIDYDAARAIRDGGVGVDDAWRNANCKLHGGAGVGVDADVVVHVRAGNSDAMTNDCNASTAAYATLVHSYQDIAMLKAGAPPSGRVSVALLNVCSAALSYRSKRFVELLTHEVMHTLGMTSGEIVEIFETILGTRGDLFPDTVGAVVKEVQGRGSTRVVQVSPRVVRETRAQFACLTLEGAELEAQGAAGTVKRHLEERFFRYDLMTAGVVELNGLSLEGQFGEVDSMRQLISRITLAYFEDTGYYVADYEEAGLQKWGWQEGCGFIDLTCDAWAAANPGQMHYCSTTQAATDDFFTRFQAVMAGASDTPVLSLILEGSVSNVDATAIGTCLNTLLSVDEVCGIASSTYDCVSTGFADAISAFTGPTGPVAALDGGAWTGGLCVVLGCTPSGVVQATINGQAFECPTAATIDLSTLPASQFVAGSLVTCPDNDLMCSKDYTKPTKYGELTCANQNHCSGGGECYKGRCYCHVGRAGCDCALTSSSPAAQAHTGSVCGRWTPEVITLGPAIPFPNEPVTKPVTDTGAVAVTKPPGIIAEPPANVTAPPANVAAPPANVAAPPATQPTLPAANPSTDLPSSEVGSPLLTGIVVGANGQAASPAAGVAEPGAEPATAANAALPPHSACALRGSAVLLVMLLVALLAV